VASSSTILKCPHCGCEVTCRRPEGPCDITFHPAEWRDLCGEDASEPLHCPILIAMIETLGTPSRSKDSRSKAPRR
jgi:hypothetical protein